MWFLDPEQNEPLALEHVLKLEKYLAEAGVFLDGGIFISRSDRLASANVWAHFDSSMPNILFVRSDCLNMLKLAPHVAGQLAKRDEYFKLGWVGYMILSLPVIRWVTLDKLVDRVVRRTSKRGHGPH